MYGIYGIYGAGSPPEREAVLTEGEELRSFNTASLRVSQHMDFEEDKAYADNQMLDYNQDYKNSVIQNLGGQYINSVVGEHFLYYISAGVVFGQTCNLYKTIL